jgi:hypothetical protein
MLIKNITNKVRVVLKNSSSRAFTGSATAQAKVAVLGAAGTFQVLKS